MRNYAGATDQTTTKRTVVGIRPWASRVFGGVIAVIVLSSPWPLVASVVGIIMFGEARGLRCPQCVRRLTERKVPVDNGPAYRRFWECRHCVAVWDGESIIDPTQD